MLNFAGVYNVVPLWANLLFLRDCFVRCLFWYVVCLSVDCTVSEILTS